MFMGLTPSFIGNPAEGVDVHCKHLLGDFHEKPSGYCGNESQTESHGARDATYTCA